MGTVRVFLFLGVKVGRGLDRNVTVLQIEPLRPRLNNFVEPHSGVEGAVQDKLHVVGSVCNQRVSLLLCGENNASSLRGLPELHFLAGIVKAELGAVHCPCEEAANCTQVGAGRVVAKQSAVWLLPFAKCSVEASHVVGGNVLRVLLVNMFGKLLQRSLDPFGSALGLLARLLLGSNVKGDGFAQRFLLGRNGELLILVWRVQPGGWLRFHQKS